jgi:hypothetical protein
VVQAVAAFPSEPSLAELGRLVTVGEALGVAKSRMARGRADECELRVVPALAALGAQPAVLVSREYPEAAVSVLLARGFICAHPVWCGRMSASKELSKTRGHDPGRERAPRTGSPIRTQGEGGVERHVL